MEERILLAYDDNEYEKVGKVWDAIYNARPTSMAELNSLLERYIAEYEADDGLVYDEAYDDYALALEPWFSGKIVFDSPYVIEDKAGFLAYVERNHEDFDELRDAIRWDKSGVVMDSAGGIAGYYNVSISGMVKNNTVEFDRGEFSNVPKRWLEADYDYFADMVSAHFSWKDEALSGFQFETETSTPDSRKTPDTEKAREWEQRWRKKGSLQKKAVWQTYREWEDEVIIHNESDTLEEAMDSIYATENVADWENMSLDEKREWAEDQGWYFREVNPGQDVMMECPDCGFQFLARNPGEPPFNVQCPECEHWVGDEFVLKIRPYEDEDKIREWEQRWRKKGSLHKKAEYVWQEAGFEPVSSREIRSPEGYWLRAEGFRGFATGDDQEYFSVEANPAFYGATEESYYDEIFDSFVKWIEDHTTMKHYMESKEKSNIEDWEQRWRRRGSLLKKSEDDYKKWMDINGNGVEYWWHFPLHEDHKMHEMTESDIEHVRNQIEMGYSAGALNSSLPDTDDTVSGWWKLVERKYPQNFSDMLDWIQHEHGYDVMEDAKFYMYANFALLWLDQEVSSVDWGNSSVGAQMNMWYTQLRQSMTNDAFNALDDSWGYSGDADTSQITESLKDAFDIILKSHVVDGETKYYIYEGEHNIKAPETVTPATDDKAREWEQRWRRHGSLLKKAVEVDREALEEEVMNWYFPWIQGKGVSKEIADGIWDDDESNIADRYRMAEGDLINIFIDLLEKTQGDKKADDWEQRWRRGMNKSKLHVVGGTQSETMAKKVG